MDSGAQPATSDAGQPGRSKRGHGRVDAMIALALVAGFVAWMVIERSGSDSAATTTSSTTGAADVTDGNGPVAVSATALSRLVANVGHPVYWAGPIAGHTTEFTRTSDGNVDVRYLPPGVVAGDPRSAFLLIATYPYPHAFRALKNVANGKQVKIPGGGIAFVDTGYPQSVHFAFPGVAYQGEVYDPSARKSLAVATSGSLHPVP